ncbi:MAG TPA: hypothetical protein VHE37_14440, partial [Nevskiaceae bacterium]|nr:hypothetical protein [Nevskiaceae bacterium]
GTPVTISAVTTHAASCVRSGAWNGNFPRLGGARQVTRQHAGTYQYFLTCGSVAGSVTRSASVTFE